MKNLIIIFSLFLICGCNVERRQLDKLDAYSIKYPIEMQRLANQLYPCFDGKAKSDTVIKTHTDTLIQDGVTTTVRIKDTVYVTKTMPGKVITRTNTVTIRDTLKDLRSEGVLNNELRTKSDSTIIYKTQLLQAKKSKNTWMWIAIAGMVLIGGFLAIKIYLLISGGWIKKVI